MPFSPEDLLEGQPDGQTQYDAQLDGIREHIVALSDRTGVTQEQLDEHCGALRDAFAAILSDIPTRPAERGVETDVFDYVVTLIGWTRTQVGLIKWDQEELAKSQLPNFEDVAVKWSELFFQMQDLLIAND